MERSFSEFSVNFFGTTPAFGSPYDGDWPSGFHDRFTGSRSLRDPSDFAERPFKRIPKIRIDIIEVLHKARLITVTCKQPSKLIIIHASVNRSFADLEAVDMDDWDNGTGFLGIDIFVTVPYRSSGSSLCLSISYNACHNKIRLIYDSAERYSQSITKLAALMDGAGSLCINMAWRTSGD